MKNFLFFFTLALLAPICLLGQETEKVEWITPMEHDFGDIEKGKSVVFIFKFKNTSGEPLLIDNVRTTCGCTAPEWSYEPIAANEIGEIKIEYDALKPTYFRKRIMVFFNGQRKSDKLFISGYVEDF